LGERESRQTSLYEAVRTAILQGRAPAGTRLPSSRRLADDLGLARGTVVAALDQLRAEGYVVGRAGSGTYVASALPDRWFEPSRVRAAPARPSRAPATISKRAKSLSATPFPTRTTLPKPFGPHVPDVSEVPHDVFARLLARRARAPSIGLVGSSDPRGYLPLREALAEHLRGARGVDTHADRVFIVPSVQLALYVAALVTFDPGEAVWIEDPGYVGASAALRAADARLVPVRVDASGLDVTHGIARAPNARFAYVTPGHQQPLGITMPADRRLALLEWAESRSAWIFEDDYDCEYRYEGRPVAALAQLDRTDNVLHAGSFSKTLFPGIRLAYVVVPDRLVDPFASARSILDRFTPPLLQAALADFVTEGHFARHLRRMREMYAERRETLHRVLVAEAPYAEIVGAAAGLDLALRTPAVDDVRLQRELANAGVFAHALSAHYLSSRRESGLLLGFAPYSPPRIRRAGAVLGRVLRSQRQVDVIGRPAKRSSKKP
jgi:GntR family transcriptional regulator/MocR family aminotransferase